MTEMMKNQSPGSGARTRRGAGDMMSGERGNAMQSIRILTAAVVLAGLSVPLSGPLQAQQKRKRLLVIGAVEGFQHDSTSQAMATISSSRTSAMIFDTRLGSSLVVGLDTALSLTAENHPGKCTASRCRRQ